VCIGFVTLYVINTIRLDDDTLRADQWFWLSNVILPYETGRLSLFEAVTYEYGNFAHSHILTLGSMILNIRLFDLDLTLDAVIGAMSLLATFALVARHCREHLADHIAPLAVAVAASLLFVLPSYQLLAWSLIQFQMIYVLIAVAYLRSCTPQLTTPTLVHAVVVLPLALVLGDAIGAAAVLASLVYLLLQVALRHLRLRQVLPHVASFAAVLVLAQLTLRGKRTHSAAKFTDLFDDPGDLIGGVYYVVAGTMVGLQTDPGRPWLIRWDAAWLWATITIGLVAVGVAVLVKSGRLRSRDHLPMMLGLTSIVWSLGVIKARVPGRTAEIMQAPRYTAYTTLLGIALALFLLGRFRSMPQWQKVAVSVGLGAIVLANAISTLAVTFDEAGPNRQAAELASLELYVTGEVDELLMTGPECEDDRCLVPAWWLLDERLGPFTSTTIDPGPAWLAPLRTELSSRHVANRGADRFTACVIYAQATDQQLIDAAFIGEDSAIAVLTASGVGIPDQDTAAAEAFVVATTRSFCGGS
jgi:hypothetical protein